MANAEHHRETLVDALISTGALTDQLWIDAFRSVPRHLFIPRYWRRNSLGRREFFDGSRAEQRDAWLAGAYSMDSLVVQLSDDETAISSSTAPGLMARMLEALHVAEGNRVLEIGTGTGYNAALLCSRLGSDCVTTVDIDAALVADAEVHLAEAGFSPTVAVGDGLVGYRPNAPYDRIIVTCGIPRVAPVWINQAVQGAWIVAPVLSGIAQLRVLADESASGHFLPSPAYFMTARTPDRQRLSVQQIIDRASSVGTPHPTEIIADIEDDSFVFFMDVTLPGVELSGAGSRSKAPRLVSLTNGSWARVDQTPEGGYAAVQGGPRRLWDEMHVLHRLWLAAERPGLERFGLTVRRDGKQFVWLDSPDSEHRWNL